MPVAKPMLKKTGFRSTIAYPLEKSKRILKATNTENSGPKNAQIFLKALQKAMEMWARTTNRVVPTKNLNT